VKVKVVMANNGLVSLPKQKKTRHEVTVRDGKINDKEQPKNAAEAKKQPKKKVKNVKVISNLKKHPFKFILILRYFKKKIQIV
jgi:hypothetical protein